MRRTLIISEEFGVWRVESTSGASGSGANLGIALGNALTAAGVGSEISDELHPGNFSDIFDLVVPVKERHDGPVST